MSKRSTRKSILILAVVLLFSTMICIGITGQAANAAPPHSTAVFVSQSANAHAMMTGSGFPESHQHLLASSSGADRVGQIVQSSGVTVYITRTGNKYHRAGCRYLARSCIPISLSDAKSKGYTPCSVCGPPE